MRLEFEVDVCLPADIDDHFSDAASGESERRVLSLELAPDGIRVNAVHPDAVFDTGLWTPEVLEVSARRYGLTVEEYKARNVLSTEVTSLDVAMATVALVDGTLSKTTGAQIPVDGGNDRVI